VLGKKTLVGKNNILLWRNAFSNSVCIKEAKVPADFATFKYTFIDSSVSIMREPAAALINDKEGKPVGIQMHIGRHPVFACGNEGGEGDIAMLKYCQGSKYPSLQMLIDHDDAEREFSYEEKTNASLNAATKNNWVVVSIKVSQSLSFFSLHYDWKTVFSK
jgi:hypothetical protein